MSRSNVVWSQVSVHVYSSSRIRSSFDVTPSELPLRVAIGEHVAMRDWWDVCEADPTTPFFATPTWTSILTDTFSHFRSKPFLFSRGDDVRCLVPAIEARRLGGAVTSIHSMPFGTYGGVARTRGCTSVDCEAALKIFAERTKKSFQTTVHPNPLGVPLPGSFATHYGHVHAPDIDRGWDGWWRGLGEKARYQSRKAARRGVVICRRMDADTLATFYRHRDRATRDWATRDSFGREFFQALWKHRSNNIQLWTAYKDNQMLAGLLVFRFQTQLAVFLSFIEPDARALAPKNLLYTHLIRYACETGCIGVNFLGSGGHADVESFKKSVGGDVHQFRYASFQDPLYQAVGNSIRGVRGRSNQLLRNVRGMSSVRSIDLQG